MIIASLNIIVEKVWHVKQHRSAFMNETIQRVQTFAKSNPDDFQKFKETWYISEKNFTKIRSVVLKTNAG